jgi:hypothetical protein
VGLSIVEADFGHGFLKGLTRKARKGEFRKKNFFCGICVKPFAQIQNLSTYFEKAIRFGNGGMCIRVFVGRKLKISVASHTTISAPF